MSSTGKILAAMLYGKKSKNQSVDESSEHQAYPQLQQAPSTPDLEQLLQNMINPDFSKQSNPME